MKNVQEARFTRADYMLLPEGFRAELIDGVLVKEPAPTGWHQRLVREILLETVACLGRERAIQSPIDVFVDEHNVLQPDVAVLPEDAPIRRGAVEIAMPVLVVEVLSPSTARRDRLVKTRTYLRAGVREVWLVDPDTRCAEIVTTAGTRLFAAGSVPRSGAVPGFALDLGALFAG
ncbi:MAG: Uma2 family endonuclease [Planctomycetes bacterium]|nr:Uma2 family endonuclease [Planctomycetota bacterium]